MSEADGATRQGVSGAGSAPTTDPVNYQQTPTSGMGAPDAVAQAQGAPEQAPGSAPGSLVGPEREVADPFRTEGPALDPVTVRDGLTRAQTERSAATTMSGEHLVGLLYDQGAVEQHRAPYGLNYAPNYSEGTRADVTEPRKPRQ